MDISNFMTWFLNQVYIIFRYTYNTLDSIQFGGISLLVLCLSILILGTLIPVFLTLSSNGAISSIDRATKKETYASKTNKQRNESKKIKRKWGI